MKLPDRRDSLTPLFCGKKPALPTPVTVIYSLGRGTAFTIARIDGPGGRDRAPSAASGREFELLIQPLIGLLIWPPYVVA
jgi:hypothetical protein